MLHQSRLRDGRTIEVWCDYENGFSADAYCALDLFDCVASALLAGAYNERGSFRDGSARGFDHPKVFAFIEVRALTGRPQHNVSVYAGVVPLCEIETQRFDVKLFVYRERSSDWQQYAA